MAGVEDEHAPLPVDEKRRGIVVVFLELGVDNRVRHLARVVVVPRDDDVAVTGYPARVRAVVSPDVASRSWLLKPAPRTVINETNHDSITP